MCAASSQSPAVDVQLAQRARRRFQDFRGSILVTLYQGSRGNPIVLAMDHRDEILRGNRNLGCKKLIDRNPDLVTTLDMATDHVVVDLDAPEDYVTVTRRL
jgi:molybdenum cofactor cytidylyltransferase